MIAILITLIIILLVAIIGLLVCMIDINKRIKNLEDEQYAPLVTKPKKKKSIFDKAYDLLDLDDDLDYDLDAEDESKDNNKPKYTTTVKYNENYKKDYYNPTAWKTEYEKKKELDTTNVLCELFYGKNKENLSSMTLESLNSFIDYVSQYKLLVYDIKANKFKVVKYLDQIDAYNVQITFSDGLTAIFFPNKYAMTY